MAACYWSSSPRAQVQGEGLQTPPPQPTKSFEILLCDGTALNTLLPASVHSRSNRTALAPRIVSRELNHVSKVSQLELELKLACVQSEI